MTRHPYIAIEGLIGAGKSTLARQLAYWVGADNLLEEYANNEFLADFYIDRQRWALPMQLGFLISRHRLSKRIPLDLPNALISDFHFAKEAVFSKLLIQTAREHSLYDQISKELGANQTQPDVTIFLDASNEILLERIKLRGREYELAISSSELNDIRTAYENGFKKTTPNLISIDSTKYIERNDAPALVAEINSHLSSSVRRLEITT